MSVDMELLVPFFGQITNRKSKFIELEPKKYEVTISLCVVLFLLPMDNIFMKMNVATTLFKL